MKQLIILFVLLGLTNCSSPKEENYSFFVAGHAYGDPTDQSHPEGLYKPFKDKIPFINEDKDIKFGFLLGDVVWLPSHWDAAIDDISKFQDTIRVVRGNHDGPLEDFEKMFGKTYYSFVEDKDLFIVLDPNLDNWNISGDQLTFLKNTLRDKGEEARNIFIFSHQVIWWSEDKYVKPFPNSAAGRDLDMNFWTVVEPLIAKSKKPTFFFAGDMGAFSKEHRETPYPIEYSYFKEDNITYVATGMGGGVRDNFVIIDVSKTGDVNFRLIHLNGDDMNGLGKLENYTIEE